MEVTCDTCGETFDKKPANVESSERDFCCQECYHEFGRPDMQGERNSNASSGKVELDCERCGSTFEVYPYRADSARFCSRECKDANMRGLEGPETNRWKDGKEKFTCQNCGDTFEEYPYRNTRMYCSKDCFQETLSDRYQGDGNPAWRGGYETYYGPNWQGQRQRAIERDDHECQDCGKHADAMDTSPDVHHKKRLGWFKEEYDDPEWYERANDIDNLVTLCPSCHMKREWSNDAIQ